MSVCPSRVLSESNPVPATYDCNSRYCPVCGGRWQRDMRVMAVAAAEHVPSTVALITVTAPGNRYFDDPEWKVIGGRPRKEAWWNAEAREKWRGLHAECSRGPRQHAREGGSEWGVLFRSWEYQKRGVLHLHLVLPYETEVDRESTDAYLLNLWVWAESWDFGYVLGGDRSYKPELGGAPWVKPASGADAAKYVCKYVASVGAGKEGMLAVAQRTAQRGSVLYVSPWLTRRSGVTMTGLRNRRRIWGRYEWAREGGEAWEQARLIEAAQVGRPRFTAAAVQRIRLALSRTSACLLQVAGGGEVYHRIPAPPPPQNGRTPLPGAPRTGVVRVVLAAVPLRVPGPRFRDAYATVVVSAVEVSA